MIEKVNKLAENVATKVSILHRGLFGHCARWAEASPELARRGCRATPKRARRAALTLEALEERALPSFYQGGDYPVGGAPYAVAVGDFNGDGIRDLVTASDGTVSVLLGNGDGSFQGPRTVLTDPSLYSLAVGDFNRDGIDDLAIVDFDAVVKVYRGCGDGTFEGPIFSIRVGDGANLRVLVGDFNGDSLPDIAVANHRSGFQTVFYDVTVLSNDPQRPGENFYQNDYQVGFAMADLVQSVVPDTLAAGYFLEGGRQEGALDLGVTQTVTDAEGNRTGQITTILHNGQVKVSEAVIPPVGFSASAAGDLNGDSIDDLVAVAPGWVVVALGNGDGTFTEGILSSINTDGRAVVVADFNRDCRADLAVTSADGIAVYLGNGNGTFCFDAAYPAGTAPVDLAAGDFNRDGYPDLAVANSGSGTVSVLINAADWRPGPPQPPAVHGAAPLATGPVGTVATARPAPATPPQPVHSQSLANEPVGAVVQQPEQQDLFPQTYDLLFATWWEDPVHRWGGFRREYPKQPRNGRLAW